MSTLESIRYSRDPAKLEILNQLLLPHKTLYEPILTIQDGYHAIKTMKVRGAPAIGIVAALSLAVDIQSRAAQQEIADIASLVKFIHESLQHLKTARPTAVNLFRASDELWLITEESAKNAKTFYEIIEAVVNKAEKMLKIDVQDNQNIGRFGAEFIMQNSKGFEANEKVKVLTHCNTG